MQTAAASRMPLGLLEYPPCLIEEKGAGLHLATKENRAKPILQIDESLLRSMPIDPFDAARTKKRKTLSVEGAVNALRKSEVMQAAAAVPAANDDVAERTLDIEPDAIEEVAAVAAKLSTGSLAIPRKTSLNTPRIVETPAPAPVAAPSSTAAVVAHAGPVPVWSSEVRLRAAAPAPMYAPPAAQVAQERTAASRSSSMPPPVSMSTAPAAYTMPSVRPAAPPSSSKTAVIIGGAFAFLAVAAGVFAVSFHLGQGSAGNGRAAAAGATRSDRVTRVVDPGIRVAAPERVPTISVTMLPRASR